MCFAGSIPGSSKSKGSCWSVLRKMKQQSGLAVSKWLFIALTFEDDLPHVIFISSWHESHFLSYGQHVKLESWLWDTAMVMEVADLDEDSVQVFLTHKWVFSWTYWILWTKLWVMHSCRVCSLVRLWPWIKLHQIWYLVSPILIVLLNTNCKPWCSVTNTKS